MSLLELDDAVKKGSDWRDTIEVSTDDDAIEVRIRQLYDDEVSHAIDIIGKEKFKDIFGGQDKSDLDDDDRERVKELQEEYAGQSLDDLDEDEREELAAAMDDTDMDERAFTFLDPDLVTASLHCARCGLMPTEDDVDAVLDMSFDEQRERFGDTAKTEEDARELWQSRVEWQCEHSTDFIMHTAGIQVLLASLGARGN